MFYRKFLKQRFHLFINKKNEVVSIKLTLDVWFPDADVEVVGLVDDVGVVSNEFEGVVADVEIGLDETDAPGNDVIGFVIRVFGFAASGGVALCFVTVVAEVCRTVEDVVANVLSVHSCK